MRSCDYLEFWNVGSDNYIAINLEPITKIVDNNPVVHLTFNNNLELTIKPKHETARKVLLKTKTS